MHTKKLEEFVQKYQAFEEAHAACPEDVERSAAIRRQVGLRPNDVRRLLRMQQRLFSSETLKAMLEHANAGKDRHVSTLGRTLASGLINYRNAIEAWEQLYDVANNDQHTFKNMRKKCMQLQNPT